MKKTCVFAGSFDPFTKGHFSIVKKCLNKYGNVVIALGVNSDKTPFFSREERLKIIESSVAELENVSVTAFDGFLIDFMKEKGYTHLVRGIRNDSDLIYENVMTAYNKEHYSLLTVEYLYADTEDISVSSTVVREMINKGEDYAEYIVKTALPTIEKILYGKAKKENN